MLNTIFSIGASALSNYQVALNVHGGNVANMATEGYVRRTVVFETDDLALTQNSGYGMGTSIQSIRRNLDSYLERQYLETSSESSEWGTIATNLKGIEELFNDVNGVGISSALDDFLTSLSDLTNPSGMGSNASISALRSQVIANAGQLAEMLKSISDSLDSQVESLDEKIANQVEQANTLMQDLADLNKYISSQPENSALLDRRDQTLRDLATIIDINVINGENGKVTVLTAEGQTLVDGEYAYELRLDAPKTTTALAKGSSFDGGIYFEGASSEEFTISCVSGGAVDTGASGAGALATFKVSLDGGRTWLKDENGDVKTFTAGDEDHKAEIGGVSVWFGTKADESAAPTTNLSAGDGFQVIPKTSLSWITATGGSVNITPLEGTSSANRLSGGSLAGLFEVRDQYIGEYQERLDAFAKSLVWEVNRIHSQGAGLEHYSSVLGENGLSDSSAPLGESDLAFADMLQTGALSFSFYDSTTGANLSVESLDFSSVSPGIANFDPAVHSLDDVAAAINASFSGKVSASITNGQLKLTAAAGVEFEFAGDSSGLLAALGVNTFFSGEDAASVAVSTAVTQNPSRLNAAHVNGAGEVNSGDNETAAALAALAETTVSFYTMNGESRATLSAYLSGLAAKTGQDVQSASFSASYSAAISADVNDRRLSVSGVNLDEELTAIMKYQQYYQASAKLIQTATEMFDVVLSLGS